MAEERERQKGEADARADAPFDEDPPVDPASQQVGNSHARFFMPREEEPDDGAEDGEESEGAAGEEEEEQQQESGSG